MQPSCNTPIAGAVRPRFVLPVTDLPPAARVLRASEDFLAYLRSGRALDRWYLTLHARALGLGVERLEAPVRRPVESAFLLVERECEYRRPDRGLLETYLLELQRRLAVALSGRPATPEAA